MKSICNAIRSIAFAICGVSLTLTNASAVQVTSTEAIYNFNFSSLSPSLPFQSITFGATFSSADPVTVNIDTILTRIYGGFSGTQLIQVRNDSAPGFAYNVYIKMAGRYMDHLQLLIQYLIQCAMDFFQLAYKQQPDLQNSLLSILAATIMAYLANVLRWQFRSLRQLFFSQLVC